MAEHKTGYRQLSACRQGQLPPSPLPPSPLPSSQVHRRQAYADQSSEQAQGWPEVGSRLIEMRRRQLEASMHYPTTRSHCY